MAYDNGGALTVRGVCGRIVKWVAILILRLRRETFSGELDIFSVFDLDFLCFTVINMFGVNLLETHLAYEMSI